MPHLKPLGITALASACLLFSALASGRDDQPKSTAGAEAMGVPRAVSTTTASATTKPAATQSGAQATNLRSPEIAADGSITKLVKDPTASCSDVRHQVRASSKNNSFRKIAWTPRLPSTT